MKTQAWRALSHGARSLYMALKCRYNSKLQNGVYLSTRDAVKELSLNQYRSNVLRWFRELQYYGFIVMVSPAHHGVNGHGKAPHWRLTEEGYLGKEPTRDFLRWDGTLFQEQKSPKHYQRKNKSRGMDVHTTLVRTCIPVAAQSNAEMPESGMDGHTISCHGTGTDVHTITSLTTPCPDTEPVTACGAPLVPAAGAIPDVSGIEISPNAWVDDWDGLLPDQQTIDAYTSAWENSAGLAADYWPQGSLKEIFVRETSKEGS